LTALTLLFGAVMAAAGACVWRGFRHARRGDWLACDCRRALRGRATAQTMQTSASACARRVRGAARTPRAWRHWLCDARAVRAARIHGRCVTGKDIAPVAEQTLQHTSSSATNSARIMIVATGAWMARAVGLSSRCGCTWVCEGDFSHCQNRLLPSQRNIVWLPPKAIIARTHFQKRTGFSPSAEYYNFFTCSGAANYFKAR